MFLLVLPALLVQYALIRTAGEPYPGLVMPGFHGNGGWSEDGLEVRKVDVVLVAANGSEFTFSPKEFLRDFNDTFQRVILEYYLSPPKEHLLLEGAHTSKSKIKQLARKLFPRLHGGIRNRAAPENVASLTAWVRRKAAALLPDQSVVRVEFRWFTSTVRSRRLAPARQPIGTYLVAWGDGER